MIRPLTEPRRVATSRGAGGGEPLGVLLVYLGRARHGLDLDVLVGLVRQLLLAGAEDHDAGVHLRVVDRLGGVDEDRRLGLRDLAQDANMVRVRVDLNGGHGENPPQGERGLDAAQVLLDLLVELFGRVRGREADVDLAGRLVRHHVQPAAAVERPEIHRDGAELRMRDPALERLEAAEDPHHLADRVLAEVGHRPVRGFVDEAVAACLTIVGDHAKLSLFLSRALRHINLPFGDTSLITSRS